MADYFRKIDYTVGDQKGRPQASESGILTPHRELKRPIDVTALSCEPVTVCNLCFAVHKCNLCFDVHKIIYIFIYWENFFVLLFFFSSMFIKYSGYAEINFVLTQSI